MKGKVKWFSANKGSGYIIGEDGKEYFYRLDDLPIRSDDIVEFSPVQNSRGEVAKEVKLLQKAPYADKTGGSYQNITMTSNHSTVKKSTKKSGCFIATAVYGSYDAPEVLVLRRFRDEKLLTSPYGRKFVNVYYHYSPPIADFLKTRPKLAGVVRKILNTLFVRRIR